MAARTRHRILMGFECAGLTATLGLIHFGVSFSAEMSPPKEDAPKFIEAFRAPPLPDLSLKAIDAEPNLRTFETSDGVVMYHAKEDRWQIYTYLQGHKEKGKLERLFRGGNSTWAVLENHIARISSGRVDMFLPFSTEVLGFVPSSAYFIVLEPKPAHRRNYERYWGGPRQTKLYLKRLDLGTTVPIDVTSVDARDWGTFLSWSFHGGRFWLAFEDRAVSLDMKGNVLDLTQVAGFPKRVMHFAIVSGSLYCFADGAYRLVFSKANASDLRAEKVYQGPRFPGFESTASDGKVLYIVPRDAPWNNMLLRFSPYSASEERFRLPLRYQDGGDPDGVTYFNSHLWLLSLKYKAVARLAPNDDTLDYYPIQAGPQGHVRYFVEDDDEVWLASESHGLFVYDKRRDRWRFFPIAWQHPGSIGWQVTMDNEFVFLAENDQYGRPKGYLAISRKTGRVDVLNEDGLRKKYIPRRQEAEDMNAWTALLFFRRLPLSGIDSEFSRTMVHRNGHSLLSFYSRKSSAALESGVMLLDWKTGKITKKSVQPYAKYFAPGGVPYTIIGDRKKAWGIGRGHGSRGVFSIDFKSSELDQRQEWYENIVGCWAIGENPEKILLGIEKPGKHLAVINKGTGKVELFGNEVGFQGSPFSIHSDGRYDFFSTQFGLVYFDRQRRLWGTKYSNWTNLIPSGRNIYLKVSEGQYYRIAESEN